MSNTKGEFLKALGHEIELKYFDKMNSFGSKYEPLVFELKEDPLIGSLDELLAPIGPLFQHQLQYDFQLGKSILEGLREMKKVAHGPPTQHILPDHRNSFKLR
jgi:hypothetical protein